MGRQESGISVDPFAALGPEVVRFRPEAPIQPIENGLVLKVHMRHIQHDLFTRFWQNKSLSEMAFYSFDRLMPTEETQNSTKGFTLSGEVIVMRGMFCYSMPDYETYMPYSNTGTWDFALERYKTKMRLGVIINVLDPKTEFIALPNWREGSGEAARQVADAVLRMMGMSPESSHFIAQQAVEKMRTFTPGQYDDSEKPRPFHDDSRNPPRYAHPIGKMMDGEWTSRHGYDVDNQWRND